MSASVSSTTRTEAIESPGGIVARVRRAAEVLGPEGVFLNPDCGFATFCDRPVNSAAVAFRKLDVRAEVARMLRGG